MTTATDFEFWSATRNAKFSNIEKAATAFDADYVAMIEEAAAKEWAKDWSVGSGDDHCHTFAKATTAAMTAAKRTGDTDWWSDDTSNEKWGMAWALAYGSAYKYASSHYSSGRYCINFAKDIASTVITEMLAKNYKVGSAVLGSYVKGRVTSRIKDSFRNNTNSFDKACAWAWSKGFSDAKCGKVSSGAAEDEAAASESSYEMGFDKESIAWDDDGAGAFGSDSVEAAISVSDLATFDGPYAELYSALYALKAYSEDWFEIIERVYCNGETEREVAKDRGVSQVAITKKKAKAIAWLKASLAA